MTTGTDTTGIIDGFHGEYRFLSNFWMQPFTVGNARWPSAEHAYQAAKSLDPRDWEHIGGLRSPGQAKRVGSRVSLRPDWDEIKLAVMKEIVVAKFVQNEDLMAQLYRTGNAELIETNTWGDTYWGVCRGVGHNHLGKILMEIRSVMP